MAGNLQKSSPGRRHYDALPCPQTGAIAIVTAMKVTAAVHRSKNWVTHQLRGLPQHAPGVLRDRRATSDRRRRMWWSILYGNFNPRRRLPPRRENELQFHAVDLHSSHLMAVAISIVLLCVGDSFLTLVLLSGGAQEVNPVMAVFVYQSVAVFTGIKMAMTSLSVLLMVCLARYRFMRLVRVELVLYAILVAYVSLIGYELWMLQALNDHAMG
jgi:hypothetical protein